MSKERYAEHTVAWELPNGDSVTKSNYNLEDIETKYLSTQKESSMRNVEQLQKAYWELEKEYADKTIDMYAEKCKALEKELNNWQDGTIIVKWCELEKALELACKDLSDAIDMLRECGKNDLADMLEDSPDYFKQKAKFKEEL